MIWKSAIRTSAAAALAVLSGCVAPGEMDSALVNRYQRAMAARGAQPRVADKGLGMLRPAPREDGPKLHAEAVVTTKVVETTETHKVVGQDGPRKQIQVQKTVKTTTYELDPKTGKRTPRVSVEKREPITIVAEQVPADLREVLVFRAGEESGTRSLFAESRKLVRLGLDEAIMRGLANSLDIRVVSYDPAIAREDMVRAAAAFDYTVFGAVSHSKESRKSSSRFVGDVTRSSQYSLGVRKHTVTGADWSLEWGLSRVRDSGAFQQLSTYYEPTLVLQVSQPLLRDAWPDFNLAQLRVARLNVSISRAEFRSKVEDIITQVIAAYWSLIQARRNIEIQQQLLAQTRETFERVRGRAILDATKATIKQAERSVRTHQADLIRARKTIQDVQDALARLLSDPQINVLNHCEVVPVTPFVNRKVHVSAVEQMLMALRHNPLLEQARLAIAAAEVNVVVAKNQALPSLDLVASSGLQGLDQRPRDARHRFLGADHVSWTLGLQLEYPIGNRDRLANLRQRKYERTKSIVAMQNITDQVAVAVSERVRQIAATFEEMFARQAVVEAARVELDALEDTERIRAQLTPEFLRTKLQAQEALANAMRLEVQTLVEYNTALAELARVTGTVLELHRVQISLPAVTDDSWAGGARATTMPKTQPARKPGT